MLFICNLDFFEWSNLGGIAKKEKEGLSKSKEAQKQEEIHGLRNFTAQKRPLRKWSMISQPQEARCEIKAWLRNHFVAS